MADHIYQTHLTWTGNLGDGTRHYRAYGRNCEIICDGKPVLLCSSDPHFRGEASRYNPEEFLVASLSSCHMLSYLHLCSEHGVNVIDYKDQAIGTMEYSAEAGGRFTDVLLRPVVRITADSEPKTALDLHAEAHRQCFIARSVAFPVRNAPEIEK